MRAIIFVVLFDSVKIVTNLSQSNARLKELRESLKNSALSGEESVEKNFNFIKAELLAVLNFMNQIAKFKIEDLELNPEQTQNIQTLAKLSYKALYEARKKLAELGSIKNDDSLSENFEHLVDDFNSLIEIYSSTINLESLDLMKLDKPDISLLKYEPDKIVADFSKKHRNLLIAALINLTDRMALRSEKDFSSQYSIPEQRVFLSDLDHNREIFYLHSSQLIELSMQLQREIDLISADLKTIDDGGKLAKDAPFKQLLKLLSELDCYMGQSEVIDAITNKSDEGYKILTNQLIQSALTYPNIKLSDLTKTVLILHCLRIRLREHESGVERIHSRKQESETEVLELEQMLKSNSLSTNDKILVPENKVLDEVFFGIKQYLESNSYLNWLRGENDSMKNFSHDSYIINLIEKLSQIFSEKDGIKKALAGEYKIVQLHSDPIFIFMQEIIDLERLIKLDEAKNNKELLSIINDIYKAFNCNAVNERDAAELIYVLGKSFDYRIRKGDCKNLLQTIADKETQFLSWLQNTVKAYENSTPLH